MAQVFDGHKWIDVEEDDDETNDGPVPPSLDKDNGNIFVSIASYRDGERCGETLKSLFENAANPDKVYVGLVEQNAPEDNFCIDVYCNFYESNINKKQTVREGMVKILTRPDERLKCPHFDQIRLVAYYNIQAKGPTYSRSLNRKNLGNEEFCAQVDAHTQFVNRWDEIAIEEWKQTKNEFGIITHVPPPVKDKEQYMEGGELETEVPRQCAVRFRDNGFPNYDSPADGKVKDLVRPLLSNGWSAAFSFAKCHLEESAPYDNFSAWAMPIEQFSRYARFWTRGYDTYTPTQTIVFHDYEPQTNGHGNNEWFNRQRDRFRKLSIERVKTALQIAGGLTSEADQANLGLYGIGKRRTLEDLQKFLNMDFRTLKGNVGENLTCTGFEWVPYDAAISPTENLFNNPDNLDPQPEYPLRTELIYYEQILVEQGVHDLQVTDELQDQRLLVDGLSSDIAVESPFDNMPSTPTLLFFWLLGLLLWAFYFLAPFTSKKRRKKAGGMDKQV